MKDSAAIAQRSMGVEALDIDQLAEAERIAVLYAPRPLRKRYYSLLRLDAQLGRIALNQREPALAQLKLAWWRDACGRLDEAKGAPLLAELKRVWEGEGTILAALVDGWEEAAAGEGTFASGLDKLGEARATAFATAAGVSGDGDCLVAARRWTLVTLADAAPDPEQRTAIFSIARALPATRLPRSLRPLAVLDGLARRALRRSSGLLIGDRRSPLAALRLGIFGR